MSADGRAGRRGLAGSTADCQPLNFVPSFGFIYLFDRKELKVINQHGH